METYLHLTTASVIIICLSKIF